MKVKIKKLRPDAVIPTYGSAGAACFDLAVPYRHLIDTKYLHAGDTLVIPTGLTFEIPEGHVMLVFSRSGHGFKHNVRLANCVGVIDSDYRGEVMVKLTADIDDGDEVPLSALNAMKIKPGDRIAQAMIVPFPRVEVFMVVDELSETERGAGGLGSTGA